MYIQRKKVLVSAHAVSPYLVGPVAHGKLGHDLERGVARQRREGGGFGGRQGRVKFDDATLQHGNGRGDDHGGLEGGGGVNRWREIAQQKIRLINKPIS